jgi:hypothetical protein
MVAAGRTDQYKYAVMQLVGPDLGKLRRAMPNKKLVFGGLVCNLDNFIRRYSFDFTLISDSH